MLREIATRLSTDIHPFLESLIATEDQKITGQHLNGRTLVGPSLCCQQKLMSQEQIPGKHVRNPERAGS
jgi:hypothetical protein